MLAAFGTAVPFLSNRKLLQEYMIKVVSQPCNGIQMKPYSLYSGSALACSDSSAESQHTEYYASLPRFQLQGFI